MQNFNEVSVIFVTLCLLYNVVANDSKNCDFCDILQFYDSIGKHPQNKTYAKQSLDINGRPFYVSMDDATIWWNNRSNSWDFHKLGVENFRSPATLELFFTLKNVTCLTSKIFRGKWTQLWQEGNKVAQAKCLKNICPVLVQKENWKSIAHHVDIEVKTIRSCEYQGQAHKICSKNECDEHFWCAKSVNAFCTQSCEMETPDCNPLQSNDSKVGRNQNLTKLEIETNVSNSKEDLFIILVVLGALALLILMIFLILYCKGKLYCCSLNKIPTEHHTPEISNEANPIEMDTMVDTNQRETVLQRQTSSMNEYSANEGEIMLERQTSTIKDGDPSKINPLHPSSMYSCSIDHILEHEFCHFGIGQ